MFSLRWKLTFGLLGLTLAFVGAYILLAKATFESDKISYVFETQQNQVEAMASDLQRDFEKALFDVRTFAFLTQTGGRKPSEALKNFFDGEERLIAIEGTSQDGTKSYFKLEKTAGWLNRIPAYKTDWRDPKPVYGSLGAGTFSVTIGAPDERQEGLILKGVFRPPAVLSEPYQGEVLFMSEGPTVALNTKLETVSAENLKQLITKMKDSQATITRTERIAGEDELISRSRSVQGFSFWAVTPRAEALGALKILYQKSTLFFGFSAFAALALALFLSYTLTKNINVLTAVARKVARGDFSEKPSARSRDEVGVLANTFGTMITEIQRLMSEMGDKIRMENELKTAGIIQESLFPAKKEAQEGIISLAGYYKTSSECGGDWWSYFQARNEFQALVGDATGHGTPAALLTAAARSIYTHIQTKNYSLSEQADLLDRSIADCSNGRLAMTAFLLRIDCTTGVASYLNASHEDPVLLTPTEDGKYSAEFLTSVMSSTLGERKGLWAENSFVLEPGQRLVMWTDGITAIPANADKPMGDKRLLKQFEKASAAAKTPKELCRILFENMHEFGNHLPLIDDVTLIVLENIKKRG